MPILEKIAKPSQARHWTDSIPLEYHYTAGVAGEEFRRELKKTGRFLASTCTKCRNRYVPARMFCPSCFIEMTETEPIEESGYVYSYTTVKRNRAGQPEEDTVVALVKFEDVKGGIVHKLETGEPDKASIGMKVTPVLKNPEQRTGALTDIIAFKPE